LVVNWEEAHLKVCDFGLSGVLTKKSLRQSDRQAVDDIPEDSKNYGTPWYAAPEIATDPNSKKVDVFSFAVV
jgi:serine/threonine protein kinase